MQQSEVSRRSFLKNAAVLSTVAGVFPTILTAQTGANKPVDVKQASANEKINLACVGCGNQGAHDIKQFAATDLINVVALCDVDLGAPHTTEIIEKFPEAKHFKDFRKMFDTMSSQIDAVSIGIPDFAHFAVAMTAIKLGKHVFVEKPLARTFYQNELLMQAAAKYKVVTQMGNQGHSEANYFQFKAWVDAGIIKDVTAITAHMNSSRRWHGWDPKITHFPAGEPLPATLDWDTWLNIAQYHDYNHDYHNGQWRCWFDFGLGALGDWGCHIIDTAHQFLELGLPNEINPLKLDGHNDYFFPMASTLLFKFPARKKMPAVDITWYDGVNNLPPIPAGYGVQGLDPNIPAPSSGELKASLNPGKIIYSKQLTFKGGSHGSTLQIIPEEKAKAMESKLPEVPKTTSNHYKNFLLACKGLEKTRSPFEVSAPLSQVMNLGVIAQLTHEKLLFDREKKVITNNAFANALLVGPPPRKGWEQYYQV